MDWVRNKKSADAGIGQRSTRRRRKKIDDEPKTLKELGERVKVVNTGLKQETLDIIMKKRGMSKSVHDNEVNEDHLRPKVKENISEHTLENIKNNKIEKGGAEEANNPYARTQLTSYQRIDDDRIHRREMRGHESREILKKHHIKLPPKLQKDALEKVKNNPHAQAKNFEKAAIQRASSRIFSFSLKNNKYYKEFAKYLGKKSAEQEKQSEQKTVRKFAKDEDKKRASELIKTKSGRRHSKEARKVNKRELSAESIRIAREKIAQKSK